MCWTWYFACTSAAGAVASSDVGLTWHWHCRSMLQIQPCVALHPSQQWKSKAERMGIDLLVVQVVCTGKEERLLDCDFPQDFGADYGFGYNGDDYTANRPGPSHAEPGAAPISVEIAPEPSGGIPNPLCASGDGRRLGVICRRFEITGVSFMNVYGISFASVLCFNCPIAV